MVFSSMVLILIGGCFVNQSEASLIITNPAYEGKNKKTLEINELSNIQYPDLLYVDSKGKDSIRTNDIFDDKAIIVSSSDKGPAALGPKTPKTPEVPVYIIAIDETGNGTHPYLGLKSKLDSCPAEAVILIHGWDSNIIRAVEDFDRASMSIDSNNYDISTIGFLWNTATKSLSSMKDQWVAVKVNADRAGHNLAKFLVDYKIKCEDTTVRIVAHSVGARVVASAISDLEKNEIWTSNDYEIKSIHLLGAAIDSNTPNKLLPFGKFVQKHVGTFNNLYNPSDNGIGIPYVISDGHNALGYTGIEEDVGKPTNYRDTNVVDEILAIKDANGDGICDETTCDLIGITKGQNHLGYWGFVDAGKHFLNDGAMNIVVADWKKDSEIFKIERTIPINVTTPDPDKREINVNDPISVQGLNLINLTSNDTN